MSDYNFLPVVTVKVTGNGVVESVEVDWSESYLYAPQDHGEDENSPGALTAQAYLDREKVRARVLKALNKGLRK